ncbi:alpha/beta fold hydrolase [Streptomyces sp. UNOC14_S4]|uniref:alpha/beta fold hydrolase n=1 Tax=Streptomyces sp. UNOC14_S4 TaxID=2872340 RepID=UPI001E2E1764|nr:alpha/beta hydrolase [Streptomyces sp. UNOC14_S4]MCC3767699.1 alpha/beta hydrolase [Streptomyces sp. UNOC14_S4]
MFDFADPGTLDLRYRGQGRCPTATGAELYYESAGSGPPVVCLNNFFIVAPAWRNFTSRLARDHTIVTYDLRNQGVSSPGPGTHHFDDHVDDLRDLLDHLGLDDVHLIGTSASTLICRDFALRHPERVRGMVLTGPAFSPYGPLRMRLMARDWLRRLEAQQAAGVFDYLYPLVFTDKAIERGGRATYLALREHFLALNSEAQVRACVTELLQASGDPDLLKRISRPVLLLIGDGDHLWSASTLRDAVDLMPHATGHIIEGAGHMPFIEAAEEFETAVARFTERTAAP